LILRCGLGNIIPYFDFLLDLQVRDCIILVMTSTEPTYSNTFSFDESSAISEYSYCPESYMFTITFRSGHEHTYTGVEPSSFHAFVKAESKGAFLHELRSVIGQ
jgi:hypothetical protein